LGRLPGGARAGESLVFTLATPAYAQTENPVEHAVEQPPGAAPAETHAATEAHGGEHGAFPPFDPATYGSQLFWLAVCFGLLYFLMSRVALPRVGAIIEERNNQVARDLAEAGRLKAETDAAIAAYEQALAQARQNAHAVAQEARNAAKAEADAHRAGIEADLEQRLDAADRRIAEVKTRALAEVDAIAQEAAEAMVETLTGTRADEAEISGAVRAAMAERV
jgi:F-type H+-transporting ATPase subunit b